MSTTPDIPERLTSEGIALTAFKCSQATLIQLLRSHLDEAYKNNWDVPRVVVYAYLAGQDKNLELLDGINV